MTELPNYRVAGEGDTTVFLLHGAYGDGRYFADLAASLNAAGYRTVTWDCPGYGTSPAVDPPVIERFADAATEMVRKEATAHNVILGHSMGGLIAPRVAVAEPRIGGVVLSATSSGFVNRSPEDQRKFLEERLAPIENGMDIRGYAQPLITYMMAKGACGPLVDHVFDVVLSMKTETFRTSIKALAMYDGIPSLRAVKQPTLLIAGSEDPACTAEGMRRIDDLLADSEFYQIDGVGHYGFAEKPSEYKAILLDFLGRKFSSGSVSA